MERVRDAPAGVRRHEELERLYRDQGSRLWRAVLAFAGDPELGLDFTRVVHAEQEYEWRRPLRVGETLTVRAHIASIRQKAGTGFLTIRSELFGADGDVAVLAWATLIERSA